MRVQTRQDKVQAERLARVLLEGTGLSSFRFGTSFALQFERNEMTYFDAHELPWAVELRLLGKWWFHTQAEWRQTVEKLAPQQMAEPEEPVQAYELVRLRWSEGSTVERVAFNEEHMTITFANGTCLSVSPLSPEGYAWTISLPDVCESDALWSVVCEDGELFLRTPEWLTE